MASGISHRYVLTWKIVTLVMICHVWYSKSLDPNIPSTCPTGCECPEIGKLVCKGLMTIGQITNRSLIHSLTVNFHNMTELKAGDLAGFDHLEQLDLGEGSLGTIAPGAFDDVKDTIVRIDLEKNQLTEVKSGAFKDLKQLDDLLLGINHISKLEADAFVNLPQLVTLSFKSNHIDTIDQGAFKDLLKIENLNLYYNYLPEIPTSAINSLSTLKELTLSFNQIQHITETTDLLLPHLETIHLDSNPITELATFPKISESLKTLNLQFTYLEKVGKATWKNVASINQLHLSGTKLKTVNEGMFEGLVNLTRLFLRDMPMLESIGSHTFKGLSKLTSVDFASSPMLTDIAEDALLFTNITSFFAYDCKFTTFPPKLLEWSRMKLVMIKDNPINCDCNAKWMTNATMFVNNSDVKESFDKLTCAAPESLKYAKLTSVHPDRFICHHDDHIKRVATGVIVVIICAIFMITFAVIMKFRKRIMSSCRRYYQYRRYQNDLVFTVENDTSVAELDDGDNMDGRPLKDMRLEM